VNDSRTAVMQREEDYLRYIFEAERAGLVARVGEVYRRLGVSPASVVGMYRKLEGKRLIRYERCPGASLTHEGRG